MTYFVDTDPGLILKSGDFLELNGNEVALRPGRWIVKRADGKPKLGNFQIHDRLAITFTEPGVLHGKGCVYIQLSPPEPEVPENELIPLPDPEPEDRDEMWLAFQRFARRYGMAQTHALPVQSDDELLEDDEIYGADEDSYLPIDLPEDFLNAEPEEQIQEEEPVAEEEEAPSEENELEEDKTP